MRKRYIQQKVTKQIFADSAGVCCICGQDIRNKNGVIAQQAHIYGLNPNSARYDGSLSNKFLNSSENLIAVCPNCHMEIDQISPDKYPAEKLFEFKYRHISNFIIDRFNRRLNDIYDYLEGVGDEDINSTKDAEILIENERITYLNNSRNSLPDSEIKELEMELKSISRKILRKIDYIFRDKEDE